MKKLIVGGTFDENGGKSSYIVSQLADSLGDGWECVNGGGHPVRTVVSTDIL